MHDGHSSEAYWCCKNGVHRSRWGYCDQIIKHTKLECLCLLPQLWCCKNGVHRSRWGYCDQIIIGMFVFAASWHIPHALHITSNIEFIVQHDEYLKIMTWSDIRSKVQRSKCPFSKACSRMDSTLVNHIILKPLSCFVASLTGACLTGICRLAELGFKIYIRLSWRKSSCHGNA